MMCSQQLEPTGLLVRLVLFIGCVALQVKQQLLDTEQDYDQLQNTPFVTSLGITLDDLKWAADMTTSRAFAVPKGLGGARGQLKVCLPLCMMLRKVHCSHIRILCSKHPDSPDVPFRAGLLHVVACTTLAQQPNIQIIFRVRACNR